MGDFLDFRTMITPRLIQAFFISASLLCIGLGILLIVQGNNTGILSGFGLAILGPFLVRVYCELMILFFKMHETLNDIHDLTADRIDEEARRHTLVR